MNELKDELYATPIDDWHHVPITANHHKWWLQWYRIDDDGGFFFSFASPGKKRRYSYYTDGGRVVIANIAGPDNGARIAWYDAAWDDNPAKLDAVMRRTPQHIIDRLHMLLDAIG